MVVSNSEPYIFATIIVLIEPVANKSRPEKPGGTPYILFCMDSSCVNAIIHPPLHCRPRANHPGFISHPGTYKTYRNCGFCVPEWSDRSDFDVLDCWSMIVVRAGGYLQFCRSSHPRKHDQKPQVCRSHLSSGYP